MMPVLCWLMLGVSCATSKQWLKAKQAPFSGFLRNEKYLQTDPSGGPFYYSARTISATALKKDQECRSLWIAPVDLRYLRPTSKALTAAQESRGLHRPSLEVAAALWQEFYRAFAGNAAARYRIVDQPVQGCVELRLALVEFDQTNAAGNTVKTVAGSFIGPFAMIASPFVKGQIAVEGKLIVHGSGEVLYQFADREADPVTVISVRSYNSTGFAQRSMKKWAEQFEQMTRMYQMQSRVRDSNVMRLNPF